MRIPKTIFITVAVAILVFSIQTQASAYVYITYDNVYTGDLPGGDTSGGSDPWLTALFEDPGENLLNDGYSFTDGVLLTLQTPNLVDTEFVSKWYFTFNPAKTVEDLVFTPVSGVAPNVKKNVDWTDTDGFTTTGAGVPLEIKIPYLTSNADRFTKDLVSQIWISGISDLVSEDFHFFIDAKDSEFISVAHIQSIDGSGSAWVKGYDPPLPPGTTNIVTPEPSTWFLMVLGLALLPFARRLRN